MEVQLYHLLDGDGWWDLSCICSLVLGVAVFSPKGAAVAFGGGGEICA